MFGLAKLAVKSSFHSAAIASLLILASFLPIRFLSVLGMPITVAMLVASASICTLTLLRFGLSSGLRALGFAMLVLVFAGFVLRGGGNLPIVALMFWVPACVGAYVLRATVRLDLGLAALSLVAAVVLVGLYVFYPDQSQLWQAPIRQGMDAFQVLLEQNEAARSPSGESNLDAAQLENLRSTERNIIKFMTPFMVASFFLVATLALIQARYWQARLFNPGGFQLEFHALRFGQLLSLGALAICVIAALTGWAIFIGLSFIVICLFTYQGLAVVHSLVKQRKLGQGWLIGVYVLLIVLQTTVVLAAALGILDNWLDVAKRNSVSGKE